MVASIVLVLACGTGTAWAHGGGGVLVNRGHDEQELRDYETAALGPGHAAEHAAEREAARDAAARWNAMSPAEQQAAAQQDQQQRVAESIATAGDPAEVGAWTTAPFTIPNFAIHSAVLPTGKVLFWGYPPIVGGQRPNVGMAALWDPSKGTGPDSMRSVPPPEIDIDNDGDTEPAPIYCSGQSFLPSGAVLVTGGNLVWASTPGDDYTEFAGHNRAFTFDPWAEQWTEQPSMRRGRWYPSQVEMADGRTVILSGYSDQAPGGLYNTDLEVFTPSDSPSGVGTMKYEPSGNLNLSTYPHLFTLPDGDVAVAGPDRWDTAILDKGSLTWTDTPQAMDHRDASNSVLMPGGPEGSWTIMQIGGWDHGATPIDDGLPPAGDNVWPAQSTTESANFSTNSGEWTQGSSINLARVSSNTVLLPDGSMVTVGGGRAYSNKQGSYLTHDDGRLRQVEVYDPDTGTWQLGPAQEEDRAYHSTAVLLPDGRVMSGGDDMHPIPPGGTFSDFDTAEIYSPPYMFKGSRPTIASAPSSVTPGEGFTIGSPSTGVQRAVLMAPPATTHGVDMQQRHVELRITGVHPGAGLDVEAPPGFGVAPPGYYMLFLLNDQGVPSVARWIRLATPGSHGSLGAGPKVDVKLRRPGRRGGRSKVIAEVSVDRAATVALTVTVQGKRGSVLGRRHVEYTVNRASDKNVTIKLKKRAKRPRKASVEVDANATGGGETSWRRTVKVGG